MATIIALNWGYTFGSEKPINFFSKTTINGIGHRFLESLKSCLLHLWALWAFEFCILIASYINEVAFSSQVILLQISIIFLVMPYSFGMVATDLIEDSIAFYDHVEAKATASIFQFYAILLAILSASLAYLLRSKLLGIYTDDVEIIDQCNVVWLPFMIFLFCMAANMVNSGALHAVSFAAN